MKIALVPVSSHVHFFFGAEFDRDIQNWAKILGYGANRGPDTKKNPASRSRGFNSHAFYAYVMLVFVLEYSIQSVDYMIIMKNKNNITIPLRQYSFTAKTIQKRITIL